MNTSLLRPMLLALLTSLGALASTYLCYQSEVVHQPLLFMVLFNVLIGYLARRWTWAYGPLFCLVMALTYSLLKSRNQAVPELVSFCTAIAAFPALLGVATGWLVRRILGMAR